MSPDNPDDVERLLGSLASRPRSGDAPQDLAWRAAAGEAVDDAERKKLLADPDALLELGIASAVLETRGRPHADAARSTEAVLARLAAQQRQRRPRWRLLAGSGIALAAAAALCVMLWPADGSRITWSPVDVASRATRSGDPDGLVFRVRLQPAAACSPVLFVVSAANGVPRVDRLHPLRPDQLTSPAFAAWPRGELAAGKEVDLPPAAMERYRVASAVGHLVLVTRAGGPFDEVAIERMQRVLKESLGATLDAVAVERAVAALVATGVAVETRLLRMP